MRMDNRELKWENMVAGISAQPDYLRHGAARLQAEQFGYQSVHYIIRLATGRTRLPEYEKYRGLTAEVQVRTVLQHA